MGLLVPGEGPTTARVMLVGEAPGFDEELKGRPFVGSSGRALDAMLREAGIDRGECFVTNVSLYRPPDNEMDKWLVEQKPSKAKKPSTKPSKAGKVYADKGYTLINGRWAHPHVVAGREELLEQIHNIKPELIIGFGNTPLWALTGNWGVTKWRGSEMILATGEHFVPTLHPASILHNYAARPQVMHDLRQRCVKRLKEGFYVPSFNFNIQPTFEEVIEAIDGLAGDVLGDIETSNLATICLGLAWSATDAICIPFRGPDGVCWSTDETREIIAALKRKRDSIQWIGQNWNTYDVEYIEEDFGYTLLADFDTLIAQSVLFPGVERKLGFLSSMYCEWHQYWKEDAKDWNKILDFNGLYRYNLRDCCANWEVAQAHKTLLDRAKLKPQFEERMLYSNHVHRMARNGINRDPKRTAKMVEEVVEAIHSRELFMTETIGRPVIKEVGKKTVHMFSSPAQVAHLFYQELGCKAQYKRGKDPKITTNDEALKRLIELYPQHAPLALAILECRSLNSVKSNFLEAALDPDGKFRSSWMATGAETFRCTSGGNAFYRGGPLQNVTDGKHTHSGRPLPNLRSCIVPSPGHTIFNCDLERADLQVVVWEADDDDLKQKLREHVDIHAENAKDLLGLLRAATEQERHFAKTFIHGTDYGGKARTMAANSNCTVHAADLMQRRWFEAHPGILTWHKRVIAALMAFRTVTNRYGYRRIYFDRIEGVLSEALAWVPQSTVAILISKIQMRMTELLGNDAPIIMQGHDSVVGEYWTIDEGRVLPVLHEASKIVVPYPDPLYIPLELATSTSSWGEVEKRPWPI